MWIEKIGLAVARWLDSLVPTRLTLRLSFHPLYLSSLRLCVFARVIPFCFLIS